MTTGQAAQPGMNVGLVPGCPANVLAAIYGTKPTPEEKKKAYDTSLQRWDNTSHQMHKSTANMLCCTLALCMFQHCSTPTFLPSSLALGPIRQRCAVNLTYPGCPLTSTVMQQAG